MKKADEDNNCARITVVGMGNALLKDEGIGVHVTQALRDAIGDDRTDVHIIG
jgi:Ni,Fe-hydrogenase maturation factor